MVDPKPNEKMLVKGRKEQTEMQKRRAACEDGGRD